MKVGNTTSEDKTVDKKLFPIDFELTNADRLVISTYSKLEKCGENVNNQELLKQYNRLDAVIRNLNVCLKNKNSDEENKNSDEENKGHKGSAGANYWLDEVNKSLEANEYPSYVFDESDSNNKKGSTSNQTKFDPTENFYRLMNRSSYFDAKELDFSSQNMNHLPFDRKFFYPAIFKSQKEKCKSCFQKPSFNTSALQKKVYASLRHQREENMTNEDTEFLNRIFEASPVLLKKLCPEVNGGYSPKVAFIFPVYLSAIRYAEEKKIVDLLHTLKKLSKVLSCKVDPDIYFFNNTENLSIDEKIYCSIRTWLNNYSVFLGVDGYLIKHEPNFDILNKIILGIEDELQEPNCTEERQGFFSYRVLATIPRLLSSSLSNFRDLDGSAGGGEFKKIIDGVYRQIPLILRARRNLNNCKLDDDQKTKTDAKLREFGEYTLIKIYYFLKCISDAIQDELPTRHWNGFSETDKSGKILPAETFPYEIYRDIKMVLYHHAELTGLLEKISESTKDTDNKQLFEKMFKGFFCEQKENLGKFTMYGKHQYKNWVENSSFEINGTQFLTKEYSECEDHKEITLLSGDNVSKCLKIYSEDKVELDSKPCNTESAFVSTPQHHAPAICLVKDGISSGKILEALEYLKKAITKYDDLSVYSQSLAFYKSKSDYFALKKEYILKKVSQFHKVNEIDIKDLFNAYNSFVESDPIKIHPDIQRQLLEIHNNSEDLVEFSKPVNTSDLVVLSNDDKKMYCKKLYFEFDGERIIPTDLGLELMNKNNRTPEDFTRYLKSIFPDNITALSFWQDFMKDKAVLDAQ